MENQKRTVRCARSHARLVGYFSDVRLPGMKEVNSQGAKTPGSLCACLLLSRGPAVAQLMLAKRKRTEPRKSRGTKSTCPDSEILQDYDGRLTTRTASRGAENLPVRGILALRFLIIPQGNNS